MIDTGRRSSAVLCPLSATQAAICACDLKQDVTGAAYPADFFSCHAFNFRKHWFRVPASYDAATGVLSWTHVPAKGNVYYAYFAPYRQGLWLVVGSEI